jgi:hypothetical protein
VDGSGVCRALVTTAATATATTTTITTTTTTILAILAVLWCHPTSLFSRLVSPAHFIHSLITQVPLIKSTGRVPKHVKLLPEHCWALAHEFHRLCDEIKDPAFLDMVSKVALKSNEPKAMSMCVVTDCIVSEEHYPPPTTYLTNHHPPPTTTREHHHHPPKANNRPPHLPLTTAHHHHHSQPPTITTTYNRPPSPPLTTAHH